MKVTEFIENLAEKGVQLRANNGKLQVESPTGVITPALRTQLADRKWEILEFLAKDAEDSCQTDANLSLQTIGRSIGGSCDRSTQDDKPPVVDSLFMAKKLKVTFRPLPKGYKNKIISKFRADLEHKLRNYGVQIETWERATKEFSYELKIPGTTITKNIKTRTVKAGISAVVDVQRKPSLLGKVKICAAENIYRNYSRLVLKDRKPSVLKITQLISWAEENIRQLEDPTNTQAIVLSELDEKFTDLTIPYQQRIPLGVSTLIGTFSEIVVGISPNKISILNMNLSDSTFPIEEINNFILKSLIPKIYVPILPLPMSKFELGEYEPVKSEYAAKLVKLGRELAPTNLLPAGFKIDNVIKRKSHRDIVDWMVNGRTGVSYGFVAYAEPPRYEGAIALNESQWSNLAPVPGFSNHELRQNQAGRRYIKTCLGNEEIFKQIPDIWVVSSRSGSNKTNLDLKQDVLRIGLKQGLFLQMPARIDVAAASIKPSYDLYVMVAIALSASLYVPELIANGMPMVHFHGYPSREWFGENEYFTGVQNPSVPCGTYESGVFNFLGIHNLAQSSCPKLLGLIEPDHGTNIVASNPEYLISRLKTGIELGQIELGGRHFTSLKEIESEVAVGCS